ncbi:hypothetical protein C8F01DRAFT_1077931 [Mycena amicta]|nr:hypothetical protein C8F01DRAFT_1077931 [Mycena amicta]
MASRPNNTHRSLRQMQAPPPPRVMPIWLTDIPFTKPTTPLALTGVTPRAQRRGRPCSRSRSPACPTQQRVLRERTPVRSIPEPSRPPSQATPGRSIPGPHRERTPIRSNTGPSSTTNQLSDSRSPSPMSEIEEAVDAAAGGGNVVIEKPRNPTIADVKLTFQKRYAHHSAQIQDEQYIKFRTAVEDAGNAYLDSAKALANQPPEKVVQLTRKFPWLAETRDNWPAKTILQSVYHNSAARNADKNNRILIKQCEGLAPFSELSAAFPLSRSDADAFDGRIYDLSCSAKTCARLAATFLKVLFLPTAKTAYEELLAKRTER